MDTPVSLLNPYCLSLSQRKRLPTHEVRIGDVPLGSMHPIRVQSMTTTDTMDTEGTIRQSLRMWESGAEYVRITAPSIKEAENLRLIREGLHKLGCRVPLIADIHFTPNAAELAARIVEKVRVNPGNYADRKKFQEIEYTDAAYEAELARIHDRFAPLVKICKEYGTAMRIGTNHGSLSDRILSRYGDTPLGMVESALEFLRICELYNYDQVVLSMKASNPQVMVQAYRLLCQKMLERGKLYPLHLGVTEAGEGEDGRTKSAQGISALLMDGIGDTVRVSLTEEPEYESPVARFLIDLYQAPGMPETAADPEPVQQVNPFEFERRQSTAVSNLGAGQEPRVLADFSGKVLQRRDMAAVGYVYDAELDKYNFTDIAADYFYLGSIVPPFELPGGVKVVHDHDTWKILRDRSRTYPWFRGWAHFRGAQARHAELNFVELEPGDTALEAEMLTATEPFVLVLTAEGRGTGHLWRQQAYKLMAAGVKAPFIVRTSLPAAGYSFYADTEIQPQWRCPEAGLHQLWLASHTGSLLVDGLADGLMLGPGGLPDQHEVCNRSAFGVLQAARLRITKTEYISCPSCGRTLFDLQETTARIRSRTEHLKGVKIGIMGCIVNGPGEMADADFGYVGVGPGKIALYKGKEVVRKAVPTEQAVDALIDLIRENGRWVERGDGRD